MLSPAIGLLFEAVSTSIIVEIKSTAPEEIDRLIEQHFELITKVIKVIIHPDKQQQDSTVLIARCARDLCRAFVGVEEKCISTLLENIKKTVVSYQSYNEAAELQRFKKQIHQNLNQLPLHLQERQDEESAALAAIVKKACYVVPKGIKEDVNRSNTDYMITVGNQSFDLPGGYWLYRDHRWQPPREFVEAIMRGGDYTIEKNRSKGSGGYIEELNLGDESLLRIAKNTRDRIMVRTDFFKGPYLMLGYLFGIERPDGQKIDVDCHEMEWGLACDYATFAQKGPIFFNDENVTDEFWARIAYITGELQDAHKLGSSNDYTQRLSTQFLGQFEQTIRNNVMPPHASTLTETQTVTPENDSHPQLVWIKGGHNGSPHPKDLKDTKKLLQSTTGASVTELPEVPDLAYARFPTTNYLNDSDRIWHAFGNEVLWRLGNSLFSSWDHKSPFMYLRNADHNSLNGKSLFEIESSYGLQGEVLTDVTKRAHLRLSFASILQLERAIDILTNPVERVVSPLDIHAVGYDLYITGAIDYGALIHLHTQLPKYSSEAIAIESGALHQSQSSKAVEVVAESAAQSNGRLQCAKSIWCNLLPEALYDSVRVSETEAGGLTVSFDFGETTFEAAQLKQKYLLSQATTLLARICRYYDTNKSRDIYYQYKQIFFEEDNSIHFTPQGLAAFLAAFHPTNHMATNRLKCYLFSYFLAMQNIKESSQHSNAQTLVLKAQDSLALSQYMQTEIERQISRSNQFALAKAASEGNCEMMHELLTLGTDPICGINAAAQAGKLKILKDLIEQARSKNDEKTLNSNLNIPLHIAAKRGDLEMVNALLSLGYENVYIDKNSPLMLAAQERHIETVRQLLMETKCAATTLPSDDSRAYDTSRQINTFLTMHFPDLEKNEWGNFVVAPTLTELVATGMQGPQLEAALSEIAKSHRLEPSRISQLSKQFKDMLTRRDINEALVNVISDRHLYSTLDAFYEMIEVLLTHQQIDPTFALYQASLWRNTTLTTQLLNHPNVDVKTDVARKHCHQSGWATQLFFLEEMIDQYLDKEPERISIHGNTPGNIHDIYNVICLFITKGVEPSQDEAELIKKVAIVLNDKNMIDFLHNLFPNPASVIQLATESDDFEMRAAKERVKAEAEALNQPNQLSTQGVFAQKIPTAGPMVDSQSPPHSSETEMVLSLSNC